MNISKQLQERITKLDILQFFCDAAITNFANDS